MSYDPFGFRDHLLARGLARRTVEVYDRSIRRLSRWCYAHRISPATISAVQLRTYAEEVIPNTWSSRKQTQAAVRAWFDYIGRTGSDHQSIPVPRKPRTHTEPLSNTEAAAMIDTAIMMGDRRGLSVVVSLYMATRASETAALEWDRWNGRHFEFWRTKTSDWHRVPVHPVLAVELTKFRQADQGRYLFAGDRGRPHVTSATVWGWCKDVGRIADVEVTTHRLRATALTVALEASRDLRAVQEFAGHRDPMVTAMYTRVDDSRLGDVVDGINYSS